MSNQNLTIPLLVRASAGTGKTFELSGRYISLLLGGAQPDKILATTFTRKAAGEIRERIINRLVDGAHSDAMAEKLGEEVGRGALRKDDVLRALQKVVRFQHRLRICTLDSLFSQMARGFFGELGLSPNWRVMEGDELIRARENDIALLFAHNELSTMVSLFSQLLPKSAESSVTARLIDLTSEGYFLFRTTPSSSWRVNSDRSLPSREERERLVDLLQGTELPSTKKGEPDAIYRKARDKLVAAMKALDAEAVGNSTLVQAAARGEMYNRKEIPEALREIVKKCREMAGSVIDHEVTSDTKATFQILNQYQKLRGKYGNSDALSFDDLKILLGTLAQLSNLEEMYYRLDGRIHHLLLDEFQDTSSLDWSVLFPLADEVLSKVGEAHTFFCVGDVKQAIYGWRGGLAEIFDSLEQQWGQIVTESREKSYRCSPAVLELVNRFFLSIPTNSVFSEFPTTRALWSERFLAHHAARIEPQGLVSVERIVGSEDWIGSVVEKVKRIRGRIGDSPTIGILVSRNEVVRQIASRLREAGVAVSEEGGSRVVTVQPVAQIISALTFVDHPGNTAAVWHIASGPLGELLSIAPHLQADERAARALELRNSLVVDGLSKTVKRLSGAFVDCSLGESRRLDQLVRLAERFEERVGDGIRTSGFVQFIEAARIEDPEQSSVRVMTIHQAKGLEFDCVVLPDLHEPFLPAGSAPFLLTEHGNGRINPPTLVTRSRARASMELHDELGRLVGAYGDTLVSERLCVAYVALTRARYETAILVPYGKDSRRREGAVATAIEVALELKDDQLEWTFGDSRWCEMLSREGRKETVTTVPRPSAQIALGITPPQGLRGLHREKPSRKINDNEAGTLLNRQDRRRSLIQGELMHAIGESIEWLDTIDDFDSDERFQHLSSAPGLRLVGTADEKRNASRNFSQYLRDGLFSVFDRGFYERQGFTVLSVERELPFAHLSEGELVTGIIDRVVRYRDSRGSEHIEIIDFKLLSEVTGNVEDYRSQLDRYRVAVQTLTGLEVRNIKRVIVNMRNGERYDFLD